MRNILQGAKAVELRFLMTQMCTKSEPPYNVLLKAFDNEVLMTIFHNLFQSISYTRSVKDSCSSIQLLTSRVLNQALKESRKGQKSLGQISIIERALSKMGNKHGLLKSLL